MLTVGNHATITGVPKRPKVKRSAPRTPKGNLPFKPGSLAERVEIEIGDSTVFVPIMAYEMLIAVDIVNRLRLAEEAVTGDHVFGEMRVAGTSKARVDDVQDALLLPSAMARLPLDFIQKQRVHWEEEAARYALALNTPALRSRLDAHSQRLTALRILREGDAAHVKRTATYAKIADELRLKGRDRERQVRRILFESVKAQGGATNIDRRLLARDLQNSESFPDEVDLIPPDEEIVEALRASRRKLGID